MSTGLKTIVMLALSYSSFATALELNDFNQNWKLVGSSKGECAPSIRVQYDKDFSHYGRAMVLDEVVNDDIATLYLDQQIVSVKGEIINDYKGTVELKDNKLTMNQFKKHFITRNYSVLEKKHELTVKFPDLSYKFYEGNKLVKACEYQLVNPNLIQPITSCSLFSKGQEIPNSECTFEPLTEEKVVCDIPVAAQVTDEEEKYISHYRNFSVTGPKLALLNNSEFFVVKYDLDVTIEGVSGGPFFNTRSDPYYPSKARSYSIFYSRGPSEKLVLRCK